MTAVISVAAAAEGRAPSPSGGLEAFADALLKAAEQYPALTIVGGFVAFVLARVLPAWVKAYYRYWGEIDKQRIKFTALRQQQPPPRQARQQHATRARDKQQ